MNVLLVAHADEAFGGVASVAGNLARHLEKQGHRVVFFFLGTPEMPTRVTTAWGFDGYRQHLRVPFASRPVRSIFAFLVFLIRTLYRLDVLLRSEKINVVNIHYPLEAHVYFAFLRALGRTRLVLSVHGTDLFPDGQRRRAYSWAMKMLVRFADAVVAPSRSFLRDCVALFPALSSRAVAIHNGIDLNEFPETTANGANRAAPTLLCIAAHNPKKALDVLLHAFVVVQRAHPGARLQLVGDGPLRAGHEQLARDLALSGAVEFLGARGRADVNRLLHSCRVFVLPSRAEPFGIVIVEALAHGRPVVASAVGGIPEIIQDGATGLLVKPDDPDALAAAVLRVLSDEALSHTLAARGQSDVRTRFAHTTTGTRYEQLYQSVLTGKPHAFDSE